MLRKSEASHGDQREAMEAFLVRGELPRFKLSGDPAFLQKRLARPKHQVSHALRSQALFVLHAVNRKYGGGAPPPATPPAIATPPATAVAVATPAGEGEADSSSSSSSSSNGGGSGGDSERGAGAQEYLDAFLGAVISKEEASRYLSQYLVDNKVQGRIAVKWTR